MKGKLLLTLLALFLLGTNSVIAQRRNGNESESKPKATKKEPKKEVKKETETEVETEKVEENKSQPKPAKKGQSKEVQVFDNGDDYDYFQKKKSNSPKNAIKINPLEVLDGTFPIYFERVIHPKLSVEIGLGFTSTSPYYVSIRQELSNTGEYDGFAKSKTGSMFKLGARFYANRNDVAPEGAYFSLEYQVKKFKYDAYPLQGSPSNGYYRASSPPFKEESITNSDVIRVLFGYQYENDSNFSWDPYIGIGWRKRAFNGSYLDDNNKPQFGTKSEAKPVFIVGFKMGILF